jgi:hypothetical protein
VTEIVPRLLRLLVGIDPGGTTGIVAVRWEPGRDLASGAEWWGAWEVRAVADNSRLSRASADIKTLLALQRVFSDTAQAYFDAYHNEPDERIGADIVIEEAMDAAEFWSAQGQGGRRQARATKFTQGKVYGLALAASGPYAASLTSYPAVGWRKRAGWMPRDRGRIRTREMTLLLAKDVAKKLAGQEVADALSEHQLMALAMLCSHVDKLNEAAKIERWEAERVKATA